MARGDLTDIEWQRLEPILPPPTDRKRGGQFKDHRTVINGILWVMRTGAPWRDLPERYGPWQSCYSRFSRWSRAGVWQKIALALHAAGDDTPESDLLRESRLLPPPQTRENEESGMAAAAAAAAPESGSPYQPVTARDCAPRSAAEAAASSGGAVCEATLPSSLVTGRGLPPRPAWPTRGAKLSVLETRRK